MIGMPGLLTRGTGFESLAAHHAGVAKRQTCARLKGKPEGLRVRIASSRTGTGWVVWHPIKALNLTTQVRFQPR